MNTQQRLLSKSILVLLGTLGGACSSSAPEDLPACVVPVGDSPARGPADAWVTIIEFGDFQCRYCGEAEATIREVDRQRPGLRWVWKDLPLTNIHPRALAAAIAAQCAHAQGHFWEMHERLYQNQGAQSDSDLARYAEALGLDMAAWQPCFEYGAPNDHISADVHMALRARVAATPSFFVNGLSLVGSRPLADFMATIDEAEARARASGLGQSVYYSTREGEGCL